MKYLFQFCRSLLVCLLGEVLAKVLPLLVPASVYGLVLMLAALKLRILRLEQVRETGAFLIGILPLLFVPVAVGIMEFWAELKAMLLPCLIAVIPVTLLYSRAVKLANLMLASNNIFRKSGLYTARNGKIS